MQIASVQRLRALAALMVVIGHAQTTAAVAAAKADKAFTPVSILPWGAGVDLFFVISGFIMVVSSERLFAQPGAPGTFVSRRLERIVPLYWLFTTLFVVIQLATRKHVGGLDLVSSYLFWPRDIFGDGIARPIFTLGWTLNYEMFFYALFAVALRLPATWAVAAVAAVLGVGVVIGEASHLPPGPLAFWTQPIVLEFVFGMGVGLAWRHGLRLPAAARAALGLAALALLVSDLLHAAGRPSDWITPTDLARVLAWGIPAVMLVAAAALGEARDASRRTNRVIGLVALGDASYALYLVHPFVVGTLIRVWDRLGFAGRFGYAPFVAVALTLAITAGLATHRWFERPLARVFVTRRGRWRLTAADRQAV